MQNSQIPNEGFKPEEIRRLLFEKNERLKELDAINQTVSILKQNKPIEEMLSEICLIIPLAWQYPEFTVVRITFGGNQYTSPNFIETKWVQKRFFETIDNKEGSIEVFYTKEFPIVDEGPFMKEERFLINNLTSIISGYLNTITGKNLLKIAQLQTKQQSEEDGAEIQESVDLSKMQLLQKFLNKHNSDLDIYRDLMPFKVREILLVANLYDAYVVEKEGRFFEQLSGEYYELNISLAPRITGVSSPEEALEKLQFQKFDVVVLMMGIDKETPIQLSRIVKQIYPDIPVLLLLNNTSDVGAFENTRITSVDKAFVWNGDSKVFVAMIKYIEDFKNVENDTRIGLVRVILLVEDSAIYYSRFFSELFSIVVEQTQRLIHEVNTDNMYKILRMRARPKILLVSNYEDAVECFTKYKEYLLCVISDIKYEKNGVLDEMAGLKLCEYAKSEIPDLPFLLQSSDPHNATNAFKHNATFINKNSDNLIQDLRSFISYYLGFGNFVYRDSEGRKELGVARTMKEFEMHLRIIPEESLIFHGKRNHFSNWFIARGEIQLAKKIKPIKVTDFQTAEELRAYLLEMIRVCVYEKNKGKVINFDESALLDETTIVSLAPGSLGGKGRGLAFISTLIHNFDFTQVLQDIYIKTPITSVIGTDEFQSFVEENDLHSKIYSNELDYEEVKKLFLNAPLSETLVKRLKRYLKMVNKPLAIRSSSLCEDSLMQPFSGIFDTYLLPNNDPEFSVRLEQMMSAVKLVFASIFSPTARAYFEAVNFKIEEEKMAVIIQEVVGEQYEETFYPHISGVAQSYNYYPVSYMKPEEGFAVIALGLGKYVVEGGKTFRFSPVHPQLEVYSAKDLYKNSQLQYYAVDMRHKKINLLEGEDAGLIKLELDVAEKHGTLKHCASVYDIAGERIVSGIDYPGPRIINFANVIKYNYIPLSETIHVILNVVEEAMGSPVEIEFAVDLNKKDGKASFYLLQIKPLFKKIEVEINIENIDYGQLLLYSEGGVGNGKIDNLTDVIFLDPEKFDKLETEKMRDEISLLNEAMVKADKKYILIGPGRWGSRDRFIGIPVAWSQISNAKIVVEISLEDFPLEASLGSHFFYNMISMNVGYFSVKHNSPIDQINWDVLRKQEVVSQTKYFKHVCFAQPLEVFMDGKKRALLINLKK